MSAVLAQTALALATAAASNLVFEGGWREPTVRGGGGGPLVSFAAAAHGGEMVYYMRERKDRVHGRDQHVAKASNA
jgi:hypothetical protein